MNWQTYYSKRSYLRCFAAVILYHWPLLREILKLKPKRVIEMGVGKGAMTMLLSWLVPEVLGLDNDKQVLLNALNASRLFFPRSNWWQGDAFDLGNMEADVCFSQGTLEHWTDEQIQESVRQQLKVAPVVLISVPSFWYPRKDFGDERLMDWFSWLEILQEFNVEYIKPYGWHRDFLIKVVR